MPDSITPSPELVTSLRNSAPHGIRDAGVTRELWLINHAYAAGADQELEACCEWLAKPEVALTGKGPGDLRATRRPKPPSLKEQALNDLDTIQTHDSFGFQIIDLSNIRRALEALPND
jgi:hypothetical protein